MMVHRKIVHDDVAVCRNFSQGNCKFQAETCWWKHTVEVNQVFQKVPTKLIPPLDQDQTLVSKLEQLFQQISKMTNIMRAPGLMQ